MFFLIRNKNYTLNSRRLIKIQNLILFLVDDLI